MRRTLGAAMLAAIVASCTDSPVTPASGGIDFRTYTITATSAGEGGPQLTSHDVPVDTARIVISGPTSKTVSVTPPETTTIDGLAPGTYTAELEAYSGDELAYRGRVTGIAVTAGENTAVAEAIIARTVLRLTALGQTVQLDGPAGTAWQSSDDDVVSVDASGLVRAVANGQATVTGTLGTATASIQAAIEQAVANITVSPSNGTIDPGETLQFNATAFDDGGSELNPQPTFLWFSSNHSVAIVDEDGLAMGVGGGASTVSVAAGGGAGIAALDVNDAVGTHLAFSVQPPSLARPGGAISPAIQVEIRDASDALVTSARDAVTLSIGDNPGGGTLIGTKTVNAVGGIATFSGLSIDNSELGYTLVASSGSMTESTSDPFEVNDRARDGDIAIYKDYDAWSGEARVEVSLQASPFDLVLDSDFFIRPVADFQTGIPAATSLIFVTSASQTADPVLAMNDPAAVANVDAWVRGGGWLVVHAADNVAGDGYVVPGLSGKVINTNECTGSTIMLFDHPFVRGPDATAATADDLTDTNVDHAGCGDNHGTLVGLLPPHATVLLNATGSAQPTYATYRHGDGRVIVTTLTMEHFPPSRAELFLSHVSWPMFGDLAIPPVALPVATPQYAPQTGGALSWQSWTRPPGG